MAQTIKLKRSSVAGRVPTTSDLELGEIAINTADGKLYIKKDVGGTESIIEIGTGNAVTSSFTLHEFTATASQTTFTGTDSNGNVLEYDTGTPPKVQVFLNGVLLDFTTDYTASNGTSVVLTVGASLNDTVQIAAYKSVSVDSDISLSDNVKLLLGNSNDLQLYHDGSNSYIDDIGTGGLYVRTDDFRVLKGDGSERMIQADDDGAVVLYYDGATKLATTNDGISVTGDVEATGEIIGDLRGATLFKAQAGESLAKGDVVYISGISGNTTVVSKADADDATKMPAFGLVAASASSGNPVDIYTAGILADIDTSSFSEGDELFVSTTAGALTATAPTGESAALQKIGKVTRSDATAGRIFIIGAGRSNAVPNLNEGRLFVGNSSNQAVADDTVHVDIANSRVGIGTTSPSRKFEIHENTTNLTIGEKSGYTPSTYGPVFETNADALVLPGTTYLKGSQAYVGNESSLMRIHGDNGIKFSYYNGSTTAEGMRLDNSGRFGIGTTSPSYPLHVVGSDTNHQIRVDRTGTGNVNLGVDTVGAFVEAQSNIPLRFYESNSERMRIDGGNVGIGTSSPGSILEITESNSTVITNNAAAGLTITNSDATSGTGAQISFKHADSNSNAVIAKIGGINDPSTTDDNGILTFATRKIGVGMVRRMTIDPNGNVGINTTTPGTTLDVDGNARSNSWIGRANGSAPTADAALYRPADNTIALSTASTERMRIDSSGNVGIGTTSPASKLHVSSGVNNAPTTFRIENTDTSIETNQDVNTIEFYTNDASASGTGVSAKIAQVADNPGNQYGLAFSTYNTSLAEAMRISNSGKVGIGTESPSTRLSVAAAGAEGIELDPDANSDTDSGRLFFSTTAGSNAIFSSNGNLRFTTGATVGSTSGTERMRLTSAGNVGIGTSAPLNPLHVKQSGGTHLAILETSYSTDRTGRGQLSWRDGSNITGAIWTEYDGSQVSMRFGNLYNSGYNTNTSMIIRGNGSVGIGTVSPSEKLSVENNSNATTSISVTNTTAGSAARSNLRLVSDAAQLDIYATSSAYSGVASWPDAGVISTATASSGGLILNAQSGGIKFQNATTEAVRIDSTGKVGIGTTSPSQKLQVSGTGTPTIRIEETTSGGSKRMDMWVDSSTAIGYIGANQSAQSLGLQTVGSTRMLIDRNGNVGIGTTAPQAKLDVEGGANEYEIVRIGSSSTDNSELTLGYWDVNATNGLPVLVGSSDFGGLIQGGENGNLILGIRDNDITDGLAIVSGGGNFMTDSTYDTLIAKFAANGRIGIGKNVPSYVLDVNGEGRFTRSTSSFILNIDSTSGEGRVIRFRDDGSTKYNWIAGSQYNVDNAFEITPSTAAGGNIFSTPALVIRDTGNVGIGTATPSVNLQVQGGNSAFAAHFGQGQNNSSGNWGGISLGYNESNIYYRKVGIVAKAIGDNAARQELHFLVDSANDQNSAILSDSKMMIDISGNVGIGTTAPSQKLDVAGTVRAENLIITDPATAPVKQRFSILPTSVTISAGSQVVCTGVITVTLPASPSAGDSVVISNKSPGTVTVGRNGSNINSTADNGSLAAGVSVQLVYVDSTIGWTDL